MKALFVDIDTQIDFIMPDGKLYVKDAEKLIPNFKKLMEIAKANKIPILSSVDAHDEDDPEFANFPPHCIKGRRGWEKISETINPDNTHVENRPIKINGASGAPQIVVEKTEFSMFANPNIEELLKKIAPRKAFVYGVATDYCVKAAAIGLALRGYETYVVEDAIAGVSKEASDKAMVEMKAAGVKFVKTDEIEDLVKN